MKLGKPFPLHAPLAGPAALVIAFAGAAGCDGARATSHEVQPAQATPQAQNTPFPPPKANVQQTDPSDIFKDKEKRVVFKPRHPELAFTEVSQGLPQSGTWRGYPLLHDFNGDGRADLVASNREEDGYSTWVSPAKGPWVRCIEGPKKDVGGLPRDMAYGPARAADMDGDHRTDLLLSAHTDALRIYRNVLALDEKDQATDDGKLHWLRTEAPIENPFLMLDIAVGNLNGDAYPDVVGLGHFKGGISVYFGDGKGGVRRLPESDKIIDAKAFGQRIELADLDGDGIHDIAATTNRGMKIYMTRQGTPFTFEERSAGLPNPTIGNSITGLCTGTFRKGKPIEVAACLVPDPLQKPETFDTIGLYGWNAEKKSWEHVDSGLPRGEVYRDLACADFNADGNLDLLVFSLECGGVFYLGDGNGGFAPKGRLPGIFGIGRIAIGDIDGDKLPDVAVSIPATKEHPEAGGIRAFLNRAELWK
ncbi:MAG: VCBS repeat-containing protein [Planctomycetes bacterium]|nr:VCBS repeat-containing protein [Planctomycetota bacterium]